MEREFVQSSNIKSIGYSDADRCLEIEFNNGSIYEYTNVSKELYVSLMNAPSKGKYFNQYIKKSYAYVRVN